MHYMGQNNTKQTTWNSTEQGKEWQWHEQLGTLEGKKDLGKKFADS